MTTGVTTAISDPMNNGLRNPPYEQDYEDPEEFDQDADCYGEESGKSKTTIRYPQQGAGKFDRKGRAKANLACLRCGQPGHWAANCPQGSSSPSARSSAKRPAPTAEGAH